jgi:hypothetical protein
MKMSPYKCIIAFVEVTDVRAKAAVAHFNLYNEYDMVNTALYVLCFNFFMGSVVDKISPV